MSYTIEEWEQFGSGDDELVVNVMRESFADRDKWDVAYEAVKYAVDNVNFYTGITTSVWKIDTDAVIACEDGKFQDANEFLNDENIDWNEGFLWVVGACDHTFIAVAAGLAWGEDSRANAFVGDHIRSNDHDFGQSCIHESMHMYLAADGCSEIQNQILNNSGHSGNSKDHALGDVWSDGETTPMLGFYGQDTAEHGDCSHWESVTGRSHVKSTCTDTALELSQEHDNDNH